MIIAITEKESKLMDLLMIQVDFKFTVKTHWKTTGKELIYVSSNALYLFYLSFSYS